MMGSESVCQQTQNANKISSSQMNLFNNTDQKLLESSAFNMEK